MNWKPTVRVTSFNRRPNRRERRALDAAHIRYIARFGTLLDESGTPISHRDALAKFDHDRNLSSARVTISLPRENTEEARFIVMQTLAEKYGAGQYVVAFHPGSDTNENQPHLHVCFAAGKRFPWRTYKEAGRLRESLGERFQEAGISFSPAKNGLRKRYNQREFHALRRGKQMWKTAMSGAARSAIKAAEGDPIEFLKLMIRLGFALTSCPTTGGMMIHDKDGNRCRLSKLFSNHDEHIKPMPPEAANKPAAKEGEQKQTEAQAQRETIKPSHTAPVQTRPITPLPPDFTDRLRREIEKQQQLTKQYQQQPGRSAGPGR